MARTTIRTEDITATEVTTAKVADNAVTLPKLEDGTQGDILYYGASGAPARLGSGTSGDFLKTLGTGANPVWASVPGGLAQASQWRLTTDFTGTASPIASNLEEVDTDGYARIGSAMTESSGVFTFPVTGIWYIEFWVRHLFDNSSRFVVSYIYTTVDNGTSWGQATESGDSIYNNSWVQAYTRSSFLFDVTSTSTHKCRFHVSGDNSGVAVTGNTGYTQTGMSFLKLGDT
jgi:hypothetical protein